MNFSNHLKTSLFVILSLILYLPLYSYFDSKIQIDLQNKIKAETPQWIMDQISSDLEGASHISAHMIEKTFRDYKGLLIRYTIVNGKIDVQYNKPNWFDCPIVPFMAYFLEELNNYIGLPDVDFLIVLDDKICADQCLVPVLGFSKKKHEKNILLVPDYQVFHSLQLDSSLYFVEANILNKLSDAAALYPWSEKTSKAIWRGANSGDTHTLENYSQFPRVKLLDWSNRFPDILDAKFNVLHYCDNDMIAIFYALNYMGPSLSIMEQLQYKYQILMDGVTTSWPGAYWRFHSNAVVLKQDSDFIQWYYSLLKPFINYIPFVHDTGDIIDKIQWAKHNDEKVQEIIKNANEMCAANLTYADILYYFYIALTAYSKLQKS